MEGINLQALTLSFIWCNWILNFLRLSANWTCDFMISLRESSKTFTSDRSSNCWAMWGDEKDSNARAIAMVVSMLSARRVSWIKMWFADRDIHQFWSQLLVRDWVWGRNSVLCVLAKKMRSIRSCTHPNWERFWVSVSLPGSWVWGIELWFWHRFYWCPCCYREWDIHLWHPEHCTK